MKFKVVCSGLGGQTRLKVLRETYHETGHSHLGAYVEKLGDSSFDELWVRQRTANSLFGRCRTLGISGLTNVRQICEVNRQRNNKKYSCDSKVGGLDRVRFGHAECM